MQVFRQNGSKFSDQNGTIVASNGANLGGPIGARSVVTIGSYDGVHLGHRYLIDRVNKLAIQRNLQSAVLTFDRHPASIVRPESAPLLLSNEAQKLELLEACGVNQCWLASFDLERAKETPREFVENVIVNALGAAVVIVGDDFHFGARREGNIETLRQLGVEFGFETVAVSVLGSAELGAPSSPTSDLPGPKVSSTQIRQLLAAGDVSRAGDLLGRPHEVRGIVVHGDARGRLLGFPTANLAIATNVCLPADGIYAGSYIRPDGIVHKAAINLGRRPTFYDQQTYSLLEAFVLDFDDDLYEEPGRVCFGQRLRGEMKFESIERLVDQLHADVEHVRRVSP